MSESNATDTAPAEASVAGPSTSSIKAPMTPQEISAKIMERVHQAETYKTDGNECYKQQNMKGAIGKYHRALLFVKGLDSMAQQDVVQRVIGIGGGGGGNSDGPQNFGDIIGKLLPDDIEKRVANIQQGCYNNLAACLLQQEKPSYDKVIFYCDKVLDMSPLNAKALYRKGQALYHLHNYDKALLSLKKAKETAKSDPNIKKYITLCEAQLANQKQKEKTHYKGMFEKLAEEEEEEKEDAESKPAVAATAGGGDVPTPSADAS
ncbi:tetratricopeptide repeat protein 9C-like [Amphiura filiformis]|uniref:tetratricopeptide repeat protein 9C-like n=1 Tax=Amphiura filiformis TaxID=82378 RepID=UPI003B21468D